MCTIVDGDWFYWHVLGSVWSWVLIFVEGVLDKVWHAHVQYSVFVIPRQVDANILTFLLVYCDLVVFFQCFLQVSDWCARCL